MRSLAGYFMGIGLVFAPAPLARAQAEETALSVERSEGAESCPDAAALAARIDTIRGTTPSGPMRYTVTFAREGDVYSTQIRSAAQGAAVRRIEDRGVDCTALAQATAVTLALLYDADVAHASEVAPAEAPPSASPAPARSQPVERQVARAAPRIQPSLSLGGGALIGVLRPIAPLFVADAGIVTDRLRLTLGSLFVASQHLELTPGSVSTWLLAASARGCYAPLRSGTIRLDLCSGFALGAIKGSAHGFTHTASRTRVYTALPLELAFAQLGGALGWEVGAALIVPFRRNQFAIGNAGTAYSSPPLAALATLRGVVLWPW